MGEGREVEKGEIDSYFHISKSVSKKKKKTNRVSLYILSGLQFLMQTGLASSSQRFSPCLPSLAELKVYNTSIS